MLGAVNMLVDITEQKTAQERFCVMAREVDHRANNLLAVMQGLLHLTQADSVAGYKQALQGRISALARANSLIAQHRWTNVNLASLVKEELAAFEGSRVKICGDAISVSPAAAQSFAMMVHELSTNAVKYGALSTEAGEISISWAVDDAANLMFLWEEQVGSAMMEPTRRGTGSKVIAAAVRQLSGEISSEWKTSGLRCVFRCSIDQLTN
jgi:two-component sensor histidine kinase